MKLSDFKNHVLQGISHELPPLKKYDFSINHAPNRKAILLVAGDKSDVGQRQFYKQLIIKADLRFDEHISRLELEENDN